MSDEVVKLNADQDNAIQVMHGFLSSTTENFMVLEGAGGTGKTFVIKHFVRTLHDYHKTRKLLGMKGKTNLPIHFTATTNKACEAMELQLRGLNASVTGGDEIEMNPQVKTIHSFLGLTMAPDPQNPRRDILADRDWQFNAGKSIVIIDEASYIDDELWTWIKKKTNKDTKVIFVGDPAQLTNGDGNTLPAFESGFRKAELHIVERFDTNTPIFKLATELRRRILAKDFNVPVCPIDGKHIIWLPRPDFDRLMVQDMTSEDWTFATSKFLAYRNDRVQKYNKGINSLSTGTREFQAGDYAVNNHYVSGRKGSGGIRTDGMVYIDALEASVEHGEAGFWVYLDGNDKRKFFMPNDHKAKQKIINRLYREYEKATDRKAGEAYLHQMNQVKNNWVDLRPVFAQTINKSQGSTYRRVYIDLADIGFCRSKEMLMRLLYVACSRARKQLFLTGDLY